jgi:hypothetical protein
MLVLPAMLLVIAALPPWSIAGALTARGVPA